MQCTSCGVLLPDDARFCSGCGKAITQAPQPSPQGRRVPSIWAIIVLVLFGGCVLVYLNEVFDGGGSSSTSEIIATDTPAAITPTDEPAFLPGWKPGKSIPTTRPESHQPDVAALYQRGEDQYQRAASIVANTPSNATTAAEMVGGSEGPGGQFYDRDRAFQLAIICNGPDMTSTHRVACLDLAEAEEFEYSAVEASLAACNEQDARLNLGVARAFLNEAKRDLAGSGSSDWSPPDITNEVDGTDRCGD